MNGKEIDTMITQEYILGQRCLVTSHRFVCTIGVKGSNRNSAGRLHLELKAEKLGFFGSCGKLIGVDRGCMMHVPVDVSTLFLWLEYNLFRMW